MKDALLRIMRLGMLFLAGTLSSQHHSSNLQSYQEQRAAWALLNIYQMS